MSNAIDFTQPHSYTEGEHAFGDGLHVRLGAKLHGQWFGRLTDADGTRKKYWLGSTKLRTSDWARQELIKVRTWVADGGSLETYGNRPENQPTKTFGEVAELVLGALKQKNAKSLEKHKRAVRRYAAPFWSTPIAKVTKHDVEAALTHGWQHAPKIASTVRARLESIFDFAMAKDLRPDGPNPAQWKYLQHTLGQLIGPPPTPSSHRKVSLRRGKQRGSHKSVEPCDVPAFMVQLRARQETSARALELTILTALRTQEIILMRKSWLKELVTGAVLEVPCYAMKVETPEQRPHIVPLSPRAVEIIKQQIAELEQAGGSCDYVWPNRLAGRPDRDPHMSTDAMICLLQRLMKVDATVHGFRASFRTWAGRQVMPGSATPLYGHDAMEFCLAHNITDATVAAYARGDMLEQRRVIMNDWAAYVLTPPAVDNVTPIRRAA